MSELFENNGSQQSLRLPESGSLVLQSSALEWEPSGTDGFWIKPLFEDEGSTQRTWLMKVDAGAWSPLHAHQELEQIYVLEGTFYDEENEYVAGDYIVRAAGAMHTAGSKDGAVVMLMYSADKLQEWKAL